MKAALGVDDLLFFVGALMFSVGLTLWQGIPVALSVAGGCLIVFGLVLAWRGAR